jgi:hemerythrin-like domain-containing protein
MKPIDSLMMEHRVIERMLALLKTEHQEIIERGEANYHFIDMALDFFATYVQRFHHGKEEKILFRELGGKALSPEDKKMMDDLMKEHVFTRNTMDKFRNARELRDTDKDSLKEIVKCMETFIKWYPVHIEKEDKHFFIPSMEYLSMQEQTAMLEEFREFDRNFTHATYLGIIKELEGKE